MKNLLIVTQSFPPLNKVSSHRFGDAAPYLEAHGWRAWVLTTRSDGPLPVTLPEERILRFGEHPYNEVCNAASGAAPKATRHGVRQRVAGILRSGGLRLQSVDHLDLTWRRRVLRDQRTILNRLPKIDAVIGTFGPAAALRLAGHFSRKLAAPWIADFRDLGAIRDDGRRGLVRAFDCALERRTLRTAAAFMTVSPTFREILQNAYRRPAHILYNGWKEGASESPRGASSPPGPYLHYAGSLAPVHRLAAAFQVLEALAREPRVHFVVRSLGPSDLEASIAAHARHVGVAERLHILPRCGPADLAIESHGALANVVLEDLASTSADTGGNLTGKFLRLFVHKPPILCVARTDSDMGAVLHAAKKGQLCTTRDEIASFIRTVTENARAFAGDREQIANFSVARQAQQLAAFLENVCERTSVPRAQKRAA